MVKQAALAKRKCNQKQPAKRKHTKEKPNFDMEEEASDSHNKSDDASSDDDDTPNLKPQATKPSSSKQSGRRSVTGDKLTVSSRGSSITSAIVDNCNVTASRSVGSLTNKEIVIQHKDYENSETDKGLFQNKDSKMDVIKKYVNNTLFRDLKFIGCETQMEYGGRLASRVLLAFAIKPDYQKSFWKKHKGFINTTIRTKRNNINMTLKDNYMST